MAEKNKFTFEFTEGEVIGLIDFFESNIFDAIRNDTDIDSIVWLCNITNVYKKLKETGVEVDG